MAVTNDQKREVVHKLLDMALDANGFEERSQRKTGNKPTVFMWFCGDCACVEFWIAPDGWTADRQEGYKEDHFTVHTDAMYSEETVNKLMAALDTARVKAEAE